MSVYKMTIAGCQRQLPICPISDSLDIAGFVMFGDVEVTEAAAKALMEKCPEHDVIVTAESKGIPLAYEMARIGCRNYVVARKGIKAYMEEPIHVEVKSITTDHVQKLYLSKADCESLRDKRILIVDDVISTGESLAAIEELLHSVGGQVVGKACVLAEGDAKDRTDIIYLEPLPLFFK
ncbi:adenine phosphoribosyltransferase [Acutalibacter muris]|uniref:Adenine phosphoribosyltransferase n=1 Tax=Acutalibacter muris TaxID=1796620 RepID=A0A1Z2XWN7_9FIRM|nr:phosphoribosyltransferase family protein [Acutalibacter muris]ANU54176.1 adenine phosphoribosyltransferase [Hungateiclostridiaceae bacterium KB18]ASB42841.1 adenine phosphoribosyltransferase [Acutalibacter muris]QQR31901.1 adenine phosphoribosyltransferase [Acutalibacter muris]